MAHILVYLPIFLKNGNYTKCPQDLSEVPEAVKKVFLVPNWSLLKCFHEEFTRGTIGTGDTSDTVVHKKSAILRVSP